jgi:hypothetical protein
MTTTAFLWSKKMGIQLTEAAAQNDSFVVIVNMAVSHREARSEQMA